MKLSLLFTSMILWALWFGGTIVLFVFGKYFSLVLSHEVFSQAVNAMFHVFTKYELTLAALSILVCGLLLSTYPSKSLVILLGVLVMAGGMVVAFGLGFIPAMDVLIKEGKQQSPEFIKLHIKSMISLLIQSVLLLMSGGILFAHLTWPWKNDAGTVRLDKVSNGDRGFEPVPIRNGHA